MDLPFLFGFSGNWSTSQSQVSILILMDLPFLFSTRDAFSDTIKRFNPYSNGSSFFIGETDYIILDIL